MEYRSTDAGAPTPPYKPAGKEEPSQMESERQGSIKALSTSGRGASASPVLFQSFDELPVSRSPPSTIQINPRPQPPSPPTPPFPTTTPPPQQQQNRLVFAQHSDRDAPSRKASHSCDNVLVRQLRGSSKPGSCDGFSMDARSVGVALHRPFAGMSMSTRVVCPHCHHDFEVPQGPKAGSRDFLFKTSIARRDTSYRSSLTNRGENLTTSGAVTSPLESPVLLCLRGDNARSRCVSRTSEEGMRSVRHSADFPSASPLAEIGDATTSATTNPWEKQVTQPTLLTDQMRSQTRQSYFSGFMARMNVLSHYKMGRRINSGLSAEVFEAHHIETGTPVALKIYFATDRKAIHETVTEHVCMSRVVCKHVLQSHAVMFYEKRPVLVLGLAEQSLRTYLQTCAKSRRPAVTQPGERAAERVSQASSRWTESTCSSTDGAVQEAANALQATPDALTPKQAFLASIQDGPSAAYIMHLITSLLEGLAIVHSAGLAHCDIKPENIVLMADGSPKLCDFGAAVAIDPDSGLVLAMPREVSEIQDQLGAGLDHDPEDDASSSEGNVASYKAEARYSLRKVTQGTDCYNAPERSNRSDMRKVDVWALGCVLYELVAGRKLFTWNNDREKYTQMALMYTPGWAPPPLPHHAAAWKPVIDAMLHLDPELRALPSEMLNMPIFTAMNRGRKRRSGAAHVRKSLYIPDSQHGHVFFPPGVHNFHPTSLLNDYKGGPDSGLPPGGSANVEAFDAPRSRSGAKLVRMDTM